MCCTKCGKVTSDDAIYCQKCGTVLEAEDETVVAQRRRPVGTAAGTEEHLITVGPTLKFVKLGYVLAVLAAIVLTELISLVLTISPWVPVVIGLALLLIPAFYHNRQRLVRYTLTPTMIEIDRGVVSRTTQNVPRRRIQDVRLHTIPSRQTLLNRP